ncbi:MAG: hypothetical protein ABIO70_11095 [Pseudomonadota bacterium]
MSRPRPLIALLPLTTTGCLGMLDALGFGSCVVTDSEQQRDARLEDDDIADKHPEYDPDRPARRPPSRPAQPAPAVPAKEHPVHALHDGALRDA